MSDQLTPEQRAAMEAALAGTWCGSTEEWDDHLFAIGWNAGRAAQKEREERLASAIRWALGYDEGPPDFHERREGDKPYYWRAELRRRSGLDEWGAIRTQPPGEQHLTNERKDK